MKERFAFGIENVRSLYQSNRTSPMYFVSNNISGEMVALVWDETRAQRLCEYLDKAACFVPEKEDDALHVYNRTNDMSIFQLHLFITSIIRKLTEMLVDVFDQERLDDHLYGRKHTPMFLDNQSRRDEHYKAVEEHLREGL